MRRTFNRGRRLKDWKMKPIFSARIFARSMAPNEAAPLIAKLDEKTALALLKKLPSKRMGQVLSAMDPDKAVANDAGMGHLLAAADCPLVSLFGPTSAAKFAPFADRLTLIEAQAFGSEDMAAIPIEAVSSAVAGHLRG